MFNEVSLLLGIPQQVYREERSACRGRDHAGIRREHERKKGEKEEEVRECTS